VRLPTAKVRSEFRTAAAVLLARAALWAGPAASIAPSVTTAAVTLSPGHVPPPSATPPGTVRLGIYLYSVQDLDFAKHTLRWS